MIIQKPTQSLRQASRKVIEFGGALANLETKMRMVVQKENALGLAAPQIGVNQAVALVPIENKLTLIVNPEIVTRSHRKLSLEGCLSIPGKEFLVVRHEDMTLTYQTVTGEFEYVVFSKNLETVRVIEHEVDHLLGIMIDDFGMGEASTKYNYYANRRGNISFEQTQLFTAERARLAVKREEFYDFYKKSKKIEFKY